MNRPTTRLRTAAVGLVVAAAAGLAAMSVLDIRYAVLRTPRASAEYSQLTCLGDSILASTDPGTVLFVDPPVGDDPAFAFTAAPPNLAVTAYWHQRLTEIAAPERLIVIDPTAAELIVTIEPDSSDSNCGGLKVVLSAVER